MDTDKKVFVTVGTTLFDELIKSVMKKEVLENLFKKGYSTMTIQFGNGSYKPNEGIRHGVVINTFKFKDSIIEDFKKADLVISHAGAASCLEALELGKSLIAVINSSLMNNHQIELAEALTEEKFCVWCYPNNLANTIKSLDTSVLVPYVKGNPEKLVNYIDSLFVLKCE